MAVIDAYVDSLVDKFGSAPVMTDAIKAGGVSIKVRIAEVAIAAADDDTSIYRLFKVGATEVPLQCDVACTAITAGTSYDLGLYKKGVGGAAKAQNIFMAAQTLATAKASLHPSIALNGLANLTASTAGVSGKRMFEHAGDTQANKNNEYDFALTANTVGTAAGAVTVRLITAVHQ